MIDYIVGNKSYHKRLKVWKIILSILLSPAMLPLYIVYWISDGISKGAEYQLNAFGDFIKYSSKPLAKLKN